MKWLSDLSKQWLCAAFVLCLTAFSPAIAQNFKSGSFTTSDGVKLNYLEAGSGPVMVLIPGWSQTAIQFKHQLAGLSDKFRVIALDMRGHGDSDKPKHGYRIHRLSADVHEFLVGKNLKNVVLGGHSMGGYGGARIAMKYPYVFSAVYLQSSCCLGANVNMRPEQFAAFDSIKTLDDLAKAGRGPNTLVAEAAAWSPNPKNPPFFVDLPVKDGKVQPSVVAKWAANAPLAMVDQYLGHLKKLKALGLEVGLQDSLIGSNKQLDETLSLFAVPHTFETYEGDHTNRIAERTEKNMLPFFTRHLQFQ